MASEFKFPDVGEGIHEAVVVEWLVDVGDEIERDQPFVKVETDKAVVDLPTPEAGVVLELRASPGDTIHVGDVIAVFGKKGEEAGEAESATSEKSEASKTRETPKETEADGKKEPAQTGDAEDRRRSAPKPSKVLATPRTRQLARKLDVDLKEVEPSGPRGRITDEDVERAAKKTEDGPDEAPVDRPTVAAGTPAAQPEAAEAAGKREVTEDGPVRRVKATHLRKVIADAMRQSVQTAAHVTHVDEADVTELVRAYKRIKPRIEDGDETRFSLLPIFIKAVVTALQQHPIMNAAYDEETKEIVYKDYFHIGFAVDTPDGLIVPVIRDCDEKNMVEISQEVVDLAERARSRELSLDELQGASFTVTNIGPIGGLFATPIINQPGLGIVGLHAIKDRPGVVDGEVLPRKLMMISVSFDHRIIDGANAARFCTDLCQLLEDPSLMMVRL